MKTLKRTCALLVAIILFSTVAYAAPKRVYVDATTLTVINKAQNDGMPLRRIDVEDFDIPKFAKKPLTNSTGLAVVFSTDSRSISAKWTTASKSLGSNMTPIFHSGLDLYIKKDGKWVFAGVARPKTKGVTEHEFVIVKRMDEGVKECMLYLPMFNTLQSLEIGVDEGATINPISSPFKHKILFVGSSLTHGASASRPGACYVARMGRMLNAETPNIGLSGKCLQGRAARETKPQHHANPVDELSRIDVGSLAYQLHPKGCARGTDKKHFSGTARHMEGGKLTVKQ